MSYVSQMTDKQLASLFRELDAKEFSFTDGDADLMYDIQVEQTRRKRDVR